jgi:hypothetical protein
MVHHCGCANGCAAAGRVSRTCSCQDIRPTAHACLGQRNDDVNDESEDRERATRTRVRRCHCNHHCGAEGKDKRTCSCVDNRPTAHTCLGLTAPPPADSMEAEQKLAAAPAVVRRPRRQHRELRNLMDSLQPGNKDTAPSTVV